MSLMYNNYDLYPPEKGKKHRKKQIIMGDASLFYIKLMLEILSPVAPPRNPQWREKSKNCKYVAETVLLLTTGSWQGSYLTQSSYIMIIMFTIPNANHTGYVITTSVKSMGKCLMSFEARRTIPVTMASLTKPWELFTDNTLKTL